MSNKKPTSDDIEMKNLTGTRSEMDDPDQPLIVSDPDPEADEEFNATLKKYHQLSRKMRLAALEKEKKELLEVEKSPQNKYYPGTRSERIKLLEEEEELLKKFDKLAEQKQK